MMQAARPERSPVPEPGLSYRVKVMYGVGEIANALKLVTFGLYSLFFATVVMGLPGTLVGILAFIAVLWDALIDPFIGYTTDGARAQSRRFAFMLIGALTMGAGYCAFFSPPSSLSTPMLFAWLLVTSLVVRTANSMFIVPYYAIGAALSRDYHERTSIAGIRGMMGAIGTALAASLSFVLFFPNRVPGVDPKLNRSGYVWMGISFGLAMSVVALISLAGTLSLRKRMMKEAGEAQQTPGEFFRSMRQALQNRSFRLILLCSFFVVIGTAVNGTLLLHYLTYYVEVNGSVALSTTQAAFFSGGLLGTVLWLRLSAKFSKHRLYVFSAVGTSVLMMSSWPLFGKGHLFGTGDVRPLLVGYAIAGLFNCILWFIPQSMLADVVDEAELATGARREGALFGLFSLAQQVATGVAIMVAGILLDRFVGLVPGQAQQSAPTVQRIGVIYSVVPSALFMASALLMLRYTLTRSRVETIQQELRRLRMPQEPEIAS